METVAQPYVHTYTVVKWSKEAKLHLNAVKSVHRQVHTDRARWSPMIEVDDETINHASTPRLVGEILDQNLYYGPHVRTVTTRMSRILPVWPMQEITHYQHEESAEQWRKHTVKILGHSDTPQCPQQSHSGSRAGRLGHSRMTWHTTGQTPFKVLIMWRGNTRSSPAGWAEEWKAYDTYVIAPYTWWVCIRQVTFEVLVHLLEYWLPNKR